MILPANQNAFDEGEVGCGSLVCVATWAKDQNAIIFRILMAFQTPAHWAGADLTPVIIYTQKQVSAGATLEKI